MIDHRRPESDFLPSDCELLCSPYLQRPLRTEDEARRDLHARLHQSLRALDGDRSVVDMASERAERSYRGKP